MLQPARTQRMQRQGKRKRQRERESERADNMEAEFDPNTDQMSLAFHSIETHDLYNNSDIKVLQVGSEGKRKFANGCERAGRNEDI